MISIDGFLNRVPQKNYNCFDFVREVWASLFGEDIAERLQRLHGAFTQRRVTISGVRSFTRLRVPTSPCFIVMQRAPLPPHVGIYLDGSILHLTDRGAEYQPVNVAKRNFQNIRYYR